MPKEAGDEVSEMAVRMTKEAMRLSEEVLKGLSHIWIWLLMTRLVSSRPR